MTSVTRAEGTEAASPIPVGVEGDAQAVTVAAAPVAPVSYLSLLFFYLPLGFSGLIMTLDLPVVNAILNRMPNPDTSVAALRVAFSMALVYEASHISMIDISTALSADRRMFDMLKRFYGIVALVLLVAASIIAFTPLYDLIVRGMMNIDAGVAEAARPAFWAFLLWPIPIGWRRLCQGALIRHGHPKPVGAGGLVRLGALVVGLMLFGWLGTQVWVWEPAAIAVLAMLVSVTAEAVAVQGWTNKIIRTMPAESPGVDAPTLGQVWRFFFPLAGTAVMSTVSNPDPDFGDRDGGARVGLAQRAGGGRGGLLYRVEHGVPGVRADPEHDAGVDSVG